MTTPSEQAASEARLARRRSERQGIAAGVAIDPDDTPDAQHYRDQHNQRVAEQVKADGGDAAVEPTSDYEGMTVEELRGVARDRDLKVGGSKAELIARLEESDMERRGDVKTPEQMAAEQATGKPEPVYDDAGNLADVEYPPDGPDGPMARALGMADGELASAEERLADIDAEKEQAQEEADDDEEGEG